jgi:hypothetical protein
MKTASDESLSGMNLPFHAACGFALAAMRQGCLTPHCEREAASGYFGQKIANPSIVK